MPSWKDTPPSVFRDLERQQRELAEKAASPALRDIHLEFAQRYEQWAQSREADKSDIPS